MRAGSRARRSAALALALAAGLAAGCAEREAASRRGPLDRAVGFATYYGPGFEGRLTASGTRFDPRQLVAAHPAYPFGTRVRVTSLANNRSVIVRIVDRGPAAGPRAAGTIIDLSTAAARQLRMLRDGRVRVRVDVLEWGDRGR